MKQLRLERENDDVWETIFFFDKRYHLLSKKLFTLVVIAKAFLAGGAVSKKNGFIDSFGGDE